MSDEASKTQALRGDEFAERFLSGTVIDIGCGRDLVVPHAEPFDLAHGDANEILKHRDPHSYDCVHSSHCLEHMADPPQALKQWWELVKPGGTLIVVVPDEDLYEQGLFPSFMNRTHCATFRLDKSESWSPVSFELRSLLDELPDAELISLDKQDVGYNYALQRHGAGAWAKFMYRLNSLRRKLLGIFGVKSAALEDSMNALFFRWGAIVDQTRGSALAQIQAVVRKRA